MDEPAKGEAQTTSQPNPSESLILRDSRDQPAAYPEAHAHLRETT